MLSFYKYKIDGNAEKHLNSQVKINVSNSKVEMYYNQYKINFISILCNFRLYTTPYRHLKIGISL